MGPVVRVCFVPAIHSLFDLGLFLNSAGLLNIRATSNKINAFRIASLVCIFTRMLLALGYFV